MLKAYKYRIYPTKNQTELIEKHFGSNRFLYNYFLDYYLYSKTFLELNYPNELFMKNWQLLKYKKKWVLAF